MNAEDYENKQQLATTDSITFLVALAIPKL